MLMGNSGTAGEAENEMVMEVGLDVYRFKLDGLLGILGASAVLPSAISDSAPFPKRFSAVTVN
jgi:hypothetical protein